MDDFSRWSEHFQARFDLLRRWTLARFADYAPEARDDATAEVLALTWLQWTQAIAAGEASPERLRMIQVWACRKVRAGRGFPGATGKLRDTYRKATRLPASEELLDDLWGDRDDPAKVVPARLDLRAWMRTLTVTHRKVLLMCLRGWTTTEIADQQNVSMARISQIRRWLHESLSEYFDVD